MAATYPKRIDICPWLDWSHVVAGGTITPSQSSSALSGGYVSQGTIAVNDEIGWPVLLNAGTWTMTLIHVTAGNRGIYTHKLDSTTIGTIDGYSAGTVYNVVSEITGIVVAAPAVYTHKLVMATKNASSSNYYYSPAWITWRQTA